MEHPAAQEAGMTHTMRTWISAVTLVCGLGALALAVSPKVRQKIHAAEQAEQEAEQEETKRIADSEAAACRAALPEAKLPKPTWRKCSRFETCFHCIDDRGILHPVHPPHCGPNQSCQ